MIAWTGTIPTVYAPKGNLHLHCRWRDKRSTIALIEWQKVKTGIVGWVRC